MSDDLKQVLYGRSAKIKLADGNEYTMREPDIDSLESLDVDFNNLNDLKNIKKIAWVLLKQDNPILTQSTFGKLITFSMMLEGSEFMKAFRQVLGMKETEEKKD